MNATRYYSTAYGINDRGQVVGYSVTSSSDPHAFLWDGVMKDLNSLIPENSGWVLTEAMDINNKGQILGTGRFHGHTRAFLLTPTWVIR